MTREAHYERIHFEHVEDGFYIVGDEAYTPEEWLDVRHICAICDRAFVLLSAEGEPVGGNRQRYCSIGCYREGRRRADADRWRAIRERAA